MTALIRNWLLGVTCAAMMMSLADALAPEGIVKKILRLAGGLLLVLAVGGPVKEWDVDSFEAIMPDFESSSEKYQENLQSAQEILYERIIAENTAAYILDKAKGLDMTCQVEVTVLCGDDGEYYPWQVTITGNWSTQQKTELQSILQSELGIPDSRQHFKEK